MSSATSIEKVRPPVQSAGQGKPDTTPDGRLQPWQFFVLAALGCATAAVFVARGQGFTAAILLSLKIGRASCRERV